MKLKFVRLKKKKKKRVKSVRISKKGFFVEWLIETIKKKSRQLDSAKTK